MKHILYAVAFLTGTLTANMTLADEAMMPMGMHHQAMDMMDTRISLGLTGHMKQHQLSNMRSHVEAIKAIVGLLAEQKFDEASTIAHDKLGLTPEMRSMCSMFGDDNFKKLGFAFHKSGDDLGDVLKTKDVNASLRALNNTMQFCVECHATYRQ